MADLTFPEGFLWGAATSSHQIEGGNHNDWTEWEAKGLTKDKKESGKVTDHWNRFEEDFELLDNLGLNAYRMSVEWSRVEPEDGQFDEAAIEHYMTMLESLRERKMAVAVTLNHFTLPVWVAEMGGWSSRITVERFTRFAEVMVARLGHGVTLWCTINEPTILAGQGYSVGIWPPGKRDTWTFLKVQSNLARAHNRVYDSIHRMYEAQGWGKPQVTLVHHMFWAKPVSEGLLDNIATWTYRYFCNDLFLNRIRGRLDCLGVNYYFCYRIKWQLGGPMMILREEPVDLTRPHSDLKWQLEPVGLYELVRSLKKWKLPIYITENGLADEKDKWRAWSIVHHLEALHRAMAEGLDVRGYFHWSLTDTFEWEHGYAPKFGLIEVDFKSLKRKPRHSARVYGEIARHNKVPARLLEEYA